MYEIKKNFIEDIEINLPCNFRLSFINFISNQFNFNSVFSFLQIPAWYTTMVDYPRAVPRIRWRITGATTSSPRCPTVTSPSNWPGWMPKCSRSWSPISVSAPYGPGRIVQGAMRLPRWWRPWTSSTPSPCEWSRRSWRTRRSSRRNVPGSSKRGSTSRRSCGYSRISAAWRR